MNKHKLEDQYEKEWLASIIDKVKIGLEGSTPVTGDTVEEMRDLNPLLFSDPGHTTNEINERLRRALINRGYEGEKLENEMKVRLGFHEK